MFRLLAICLFLSLSSSLFAQSVTPTATANSDPQALTISAAALAAMTKGVSVSDVTLTGTATETAGATVNTGAATFKAKGYFEARTDFSASGDSIVRAVGSSGYPVGSWTTGDGMSHPLAFHNALVDAAWFFPALSCLSIATQPNAVLKYVGQETRYGTSVQHIRFWRVADGSLANQALLTDLSAIDVFLDASTFLPSAITYNTHPENDASRSFLVEVRYSNYQPVNGIQVPFHVQKFLSNSLIVDFQAAQAAINSGLSDSDFAVQ